MRSVGISAFALAAFAVSGASVAVPESAQAQTRVTTTKVVHTGGHRWGGRYNGRWIAGWRAPGGWSAYRPAVRGYVLPGYWVNPSFYIGNYSRYGFSAPPAGYGWSRYYDDAVLTDRYGRVYDTVPNFDWGRYDNYDDGAGYEPEDYSDSYGYREDDYRDAPPPPRKDRANEVAGAVAGAVVGAVAGNVIAGKGDRLAGSLIGGGVGAIAGSAIGKGADDKAAHHHPDPRNLDYDYRGARVSEEVTYDGRWSGTWTGGYEGDPKVYKGTFDGRYDGSSPHWERRGPPPSHRGYYGGPAYGYGYGYGYGPMVITVQSAPIVTTTTTTTETVTYAAAARKRVAARKVWKPRPKARCVCR